MIGVTLKVLKMSDIKLFVKIILIALLGGCAVIGLCVWLDSVSCKQRAEAYNLSYMYKFPAGCMIGIRK